MNLKQVTFTGADNETKPEELYALSEKYPKIEWGILWYPKKMGISRYPSEKWICNFVDEKPDYVKSALHVCGNDALGFAYHLLNDTLLGDLMVQVDRVQLNFSVTTREQVLNLLTPERYNFLYAVRRYGAYYPEKYVIIQAKPQNHRLVTLIDEEPFIEFLFDESGGKGKEISHIHQPLSKESNGYAGGLNPKNVIAKLKAIEEVVSGGDVWIDMETGVRTEEKFDLSKVESVMSQVSDIYGMGGMKL